MLPPREDSSPSEGATATDNKDDNNSTTAEDNSEPPAPLVATGESDVTTLVEVETKPEESCKVEEESEDLVQFSLEPEGDPVSVIEKSENEEIVEVEIEQDSEESKQQVSPATEVEKVDDEVCVEEEKVVKENESVAEELGVVVGSESGSISGVGGEISEVVEILSNLQSLKTPEPHEVDDGIVRASFVDFVLDDDPIEEESDDDDDDDDDDNRAGDDENDDGQMMMSDLNPNPELQRIREEQVRKWLIFEEENPPQIRNVLIPTSQQQQHQLQSVGSQDGSSNCNTLESLTSIEADSLAEVEQVGRRMIQLQGDEENGGVMTGDDENELMMNGVDGMQRRVRFLTDTEGNLLISVFMTNTPTNEQSSEPTSIVENGGGDINNGEGQEVSSANPSLVVSPPSLTEQEASVMIPPSAPPLEEEDADDEQEQPSSIVLVEGQGQVPPPPPQNPPPSSEEEDEEEDSQGDLKKDKESEDGGNLSDDTLSVSSCNSMIEIIPGGGGATGDALNNKKPAEEPITLCSDENNNNSNSTNNNVDVEVRKEQCGGLGGINFQLHVENENNNHCSTHDDSDSSSQLGSFITHELEMHNEGFAAENTGETLSHSSAPIIKVPNVDENNNVVDNENEASTMNEKKTLKFNPTIQIHASEMPELRRSSSDGEDEMRLSPPSGQPYSPPGSSTGSNSSNEHCYNKHELGSSEEEQEQQMVSLCIQEEHISAVAVTIAKWEQMMSKAQSTENLTQIPGGTGSHAPVTKTSSSPCPKSPKENIKMLASVIQRRPSPPPPSSQSQAAPIVVQQCAIVTTTNTTTTPPPNNNKLASVAANNAVNIAPAATVPPSEIVVGKAPGWNCWGNKLGKEISNNKPLQQEVHPQAHPNNPIDDEIIYAQPNNQAGITMTSIANPSAILKAYPKPLSKGEIINWLKEGEIHRAGILLNYGQSHHHAPVLAGGAQPGPVVVSWFFGLISRQQAEKYLHGQPPGTFLVRISTRIWGYTLSYQASSQRTKHFLISAINPAVPGTLTAITDNSPAMPPQTGKQQRMSPFVPQGRYAFIGTNMTPYGTLVSLIRHHSHAPITKLGGEKLLNPCLGGPQVAGLEALFK